MPIWLPYFGCWLLLGNEFSLCGLFCCCSYPLSSASGGTLSVAMQGYPVWKSPHALSALAVLLGLTANAWIAFSGFGNTPATRQNGRKVHAYLGTAVMALLLVHSALGFSILQH